MSIEERPYSVSPDVLAVQETFNEMYDAHIDSYYQMICSQPHEQTSLYISVTNRCNLNCEYCYDKKSQPPFQEPVDMTPELVVSIFKQIKNPLYVFVLGGEPFLNPSAVEAVLDLCPSRVGISTNGYIANERIDQLLKKIVTRSREGRSGMLQFSCDLGGVSHKRHTEKEQQIENTLMHFADICGRHMKIKYTLTNEDIPSIEDISKWYWDRNLFIQYDYADGAYGDGFPSDLSDENMNHVYHFILESLHALFSQWLKNPDNLKIAIRAKVLVQHVFAGTIEQITNESPRLASCNVLGHSYYIGPSGKLYPCHRFKNHRERYGNLGENVLEGIKQFHCDVTPVIRDYCRNCLYRGTCGSFCSAIIYGYGHRSVIGRCKFIGAERDAVLSFLLDEKIRFHPQIDQFLSIIKKFSPFLTIKF
ncbi:MAG: radical SAM domain containing protein [Candidatus Magnetoglobus multicellularis str. Araruama]|uniref:Radical SAM domain containing protein n=1 Tax=Candidatus Magnetoglobus multicellularis str. Araruama TaxID=890399 RepID=A0A1V1PBX1_9BACT|nr:MAG: radical SAM domain containing protein [Candidatus Magnetoglobus multicellularis str. Araruama]